MSGYGTTIDSGRLEQHRRTLATGLVLSVGLHLAFFLVFPQVEVSAMSGAGEELRTVELPPEVRVPPPPEQIARPATPTIAPAEVDDDITIAPTTFEANPVEQLPPPPRSGAVDPGQRPTFIPHDVPPRLLNRDQVAKLLQRFYPPVLRDAGIGGRTTVWVYVNEQGQVVRCQIQESSGYDALDTVAEKVAETMVFEPAQNRDRPIAVWVAQAITFRVAG